MSKTIINIKSLTINVTAGAAESGGISPRLIGMLVARAVSEAGAQTGGDPETSAPEAAGTTDQTNEQGTTPAAPATKATVNPTVPTADNIVAFLTSDPRYTLRSFDAIEKNFSADYDLAVIVSGLVDCGLLGVKRRRSDGAALYYVVSAASDAGAANAAATPVAEATSAAPAETPEFNVTNVRQFLTSDPRYTQRSVEAIAKFFNRADLGSVEYALDDMESDGDLRRTTRRSDGASLYQAA